MCEPVFPLIGGSSSSCSPLQQYMRCVDCMWLLRVCGWWCASLSPAIFRLVSDRTLHISDSTLSLSYPHATEKLEYSNILCSSTPIDEHILVSLKAWLYYILWFECGGCAEVQCRYGWVSVGINWKRLMSREYCSQELYPSFSVV